MDIALPVTPTLPTTAPFYRTKTPLDFTAVKVGAPDWNSKAGFDGSPFNCAPEWLLEAITGGKVRIESRGCTDYAWFGFQDDYGNTTWAGPGDYIVKGKRLIYVVPGEVFERLLVADHPHWPEVPLENP